MEKPKHGELLTFAFTVDLGHLINMGNIDTMNEYMDDQFEEQFGMNSMNLVDLSYTPVGTDRDGIIIEVTGTVEDFDAEVAKLTDRA